ncbi:hypothetical protein [Flexivirga meconopsidis]|uniref:hypothetical protein n=1 Tax=Flexivirga meconopsidis TaxID=2977121 RepID=UPI00223F327D|nr:hypothetical protein [Flexivirga meconopsidis]
MQELTVPAGDGGDLRATDQHDHAGADAVDQPVVVLPRGGGCGVVRGVGATHLDLVELLDRVGRARGAERVGAD